MMKSLSLFIPLLLHLFSSFAATPWLHVEGNKIKDPAGNVVILRGVSLRNIKLLGPPQTAVDLKGLVDILTNEQDDASNSPGWYTRVIRFPVYPPVTDLEGYYANTLKPAVDYATSKGLYVIVDYHHIADIQAHLEDTKQFWEFMAPKFRNYSNVLYEVYNEPMNNSWSWDTFKPYMQSWVDVIRKYAPHNLILAGSPLYSQKVGGSATNPLTGGNIVYVAHIYPGHYATAWNRSEVEKAAAVHPVFLSEWGFNGVIEDANSQFLVGTADEYGSQIMAWADELGLSWTAWVADNSWLPVMFDANWELLTGNDNMGGFVKDTLYVKRNDHQPADIACIAPFLGPDKSICSDNAPVIETGLTANGKAFRWYKDGELLDGETGPALINTLTAGVYKVEIDSNGCTMSDEVALVDTLIPIPLIPDRALEEPVTLVAGDASDGYTYQWFRNGEALTNETSNTLQVSDTCGTVYKVDISYSGCNTASDEFKILCRRGMYLGHPIPVPGIVQAEDFDFQNLPDLAYHDADAGNQGGAYRSEGVDIESTSDDGAGYNIGWTEKDEWIEYSIEVTEPGVCGVLFRVASDDADGGMLRLEVNNRIVADSVEVPRTKGWQVWTDVIANNITLTAEDTLLRVYIHNGGLNLNYMDIRQGAIIEGLTGRKTVSHTVAVFPNPVSDIIRFEGTRPAYDWKICTMTGDVLLEGSGSQAEVSGLLMGQYILLIEGEAYKFVKW